MRKHLILKLQGPMQAWGRESFEGLRPSELFPGRSALLGLLGACLGIERTDREQQQDLAGSVAFAVRVDRQGQKMTDYHTIKDAREDYRGLKSHDTIQTWREYWQDASYTVAVWNNEEPVISLDTIEQAVKRPVYTPVLGRRSCPLGRPLFETVLSAESALSALAQIGINQGVIYNEEESAGAIPLRKRDVPIIHQPRQFSTRTVFMAATKGAPHVSE
ncbi:type I-E CRISPR-associated protein Cas5/CasD [Methylobacter sp. BlB1]|uniref:type I-E CRISPR-associated protein Cas5/CasD n=1 Tax=Methylobacter sp. BlB1 TaxID=2785914 RepID=UPI0018940ACE|nr:type I-E CRISPR-associated protein Cas5/CasD [Methylobacter sp. BlB1]MBF6649268.1 type I-E CRISPR-associated protein Cas5/CasD [Methylobacter sp. BlB1]